MKMILSALIALASVSAFAESEQYPSKGEQSSIGTSRPSSNVNDMTGSESYPVQAPQQLKFKPANCVNGVDVNSGRALEVCRPGNG